MRKPCLKRSLIALAFLLETNASAQSISIDGSSTVYPITKVVADGFQKAMQGSIKVAVGISGTGGGFKKFCRGEIDINDASRPILKAEIEACNKSAVQYLEVAIAFDAVTVVVNPRNQWVKSFNIGDLRKIWQPGAQGKVTNWHQVRRSWPNHPLKLFGPGADSGTFDYFTEVIVGKAKSSRSDFTASENDNVLVQGVANDRNGIGYFGYAYYSENQKKLRAVPIDAGKGPIAPSTQSVENGTYRHCPVPCSSILTTERWIARKEDSSSLSTF